LRTHRFDMNAAFKPPLWLYVLALASIAVPCVAQNYPTKPVRVVLPSPPGSAADIVTRAVTMRLAERMGQQFVVDARPGASGIIAAEIVARAVPDAYTLLVASSASHGINVSLYRKLPYDALRDYAHITLLARMPLIVTVNPGLAAKNVKELIALAKAKAGQLNFASSGSGTTTHLAGELLKLMTGADFVHVPYKGSQQALLDTISGQTSMNIAPILTSLPQVKAGRLRALAVTTPSRSATAPDIPAVGESVPGYEATLWYGLSAPAGTPRAIVARLNKEATTILAMEDARGSLQQQGADAAPTTPEAFEAYVKSEVAKWAKVVQASGARPE
jgi:tripartite-type tricarboxylate transporter receptor subunit TctC